MAGWVSVVRGANGFGPYGAGDYRVGPDKPGGRTNPGAGLIRGPDKSGAEQVRGPDESGPSYRFSHTDT